MKRLWLIAMTVFLAIGCYVPLASELVSASTILAITDNDYSDSAPQIDAGQVVWQGNDGSDVEIYLFDGSSTTQLTNNEYNDFLPQIDDGKVVWYGADDNDYEIFLYDGNSTIQLTDNDYDDSLPQIDAGQVVWQGENGNDNEIFLYDGNSTIQLTDNDYDDYLPQIDNGQVVWRESDGNDYEIFLYDGNSTIQLTDNDYDDYLPQIDAGQVVWHESDGNDNEIFLYDGIYTTQLTNNNHMDSSPQIYSGKVVWEGNDGNDKEIYLYDGSSTTQLTDNDYDDYLPQIDNGQVVWHGSDDGNDYEIYLYDGNSTISLTDNVYNDSSPQIDNEQVVWIQNDGNDKELYLYRTFAILIDEQFPDPTNDDTPTLTGTVTLGFSEIATVEYRVDTESWTLAEFTANTGDTKSGTYIFTIPSLSDGSHTVEVRATDILGNTTTNYASDTFTVDATSPSVGTPSLVMTNGEAHTFSGTVTDSMGNVETVEYRADGGDWQEATVTPNDSTSWDYTFVVDLADGEHTIEVRAIDDVGNIVADTNYATTGAFTVGADDGSNTWIIAIVAIIALGGLLVYLLVIRKRRNRL